MPTVPQEDGDYGALYYEDCDDGQELESVQKVDTVDKAGLQKMDDYDFVVKEVWHQDNPNKKPPELDTQIIKAIYKLHFDFECTRVAIQCIRVAIQR